MQGIPSTCATTGIARRQARTQTTAILRAPGKRKVLLAYMFLPATGRDLVSGWVGGQEEGALCLCDGWVGGWVVVVMDGVLCGDSWCGLVSGSRVCIPNVPLCACTAVSHGISGFLMVFRHSSCRDYCALLH